MVFAPAFALAGGHFEIELEFDFGFAEYVRDFEIFLEGLPELRSCFSDRICPKLHLVVGARNHMAIDPAWPGLRVRNPFDIEDESIFEGWH